VTHGDYSMGVPLAQRAVGGFRWLFGNGVRDELLPYLRISRKLLLDATADATVPWTNMIVSLNGGYPTGDPRSYGGRPVALSRPGSRASQARAPCCSTSSPCRCLTPSIRVVPD
jgi:hypothetical protein